MVDIDMARTAPPVPGLGPAEAVAPARRTTGRRERRFVPTRRQALVLVLRLAVLALVLTAWEFGTGTRGQDGFMLVDEYYVSKPSQIWEAIVRWSDQGILWSNVWITMQTTVVGFLIGAAVGLVVGVALGVNQLASEVFKPFVTALNSIPRLALVPLFLLWFGLGISSKLALVATIVFFLVFYNTYAGVKDVDRELVDMMRLMQAPARKIHAKVTLPSAVTWIIAGLRISVPYALVAAVTAEMISSNRGMGYLLQRAAGQFATEGVFAAIVVMVVMALFLTGFVTLLERRLLRWKPDRLATERASR